MGRSQQLEAQATKIKAGTVLRDGGTTPVVAGGCQEENTETGPATPCARLGGGRQHLTIGETCLPGRDTEAEIQAYKLQVHPYHMPSALNSHFK